MMKEPLPDCPGRSDAKYGHVADCLRREIVDGRWRIGQRLPTWDQLCVRYAVGRPTLTRALSVLKQEGFVNAPSTRGTYVTERPPHLHRHVLLFSSAPGREGFGGWNLFWDALALKALALRAEGRHEIEVLFDVTPHVDCTAFAGVVSDLQRSRLAGVWVVNSVELTHLPLPEGSPTVRIFSSRPREGSPSVGVDWDSFHAQATDWLVEKQCSRVAVISNKQAASDACAAWVRRRSVKILPAWTLSMPGTHPEGVRNLVRLLMSGPSQRRPNGLIVADDNLLDGVMAGLTDAHVAIPEDIRVIAHCNWPAPPSPLRVRRLGFDVGALLEGCIAATHAQRSGHPPAAPFVVPASFAPLDRSNTAPELPAPMPEPDRALRDQPQGTAQCA